MIAAVQSAYSDFGQAADPYDIGVFIQQVVDEPEWRSEAKLNAAFFDGLQHSTEALRKMREAGIKPATINKIQSTLKNIMGRERTMRTNPIVVPEDDDSTEGAEALSAEIQRAWRLMDANRNISDAFATALKTGVGWVGALKTDDPFKSDYPWLSPYVRWQEMWWDMQAIDPLYRDGRYMIRSRWETVEKIKAWWPQLSRALNRTMNAPRLSPETILDAWGTGIPQGQRMDIEIYESLEEREWINQDSKKLRLFEVWYKVPRRVKALRHHESGRTVLYKPKNPAHQFAVATGQAEILAGPTDFMRMAWYAGAIRLSDTPTPFAHNHFPYVPVLCGREDDSGVPYGLVRPMRSPQELLNDRNARLHYDLLAHKMKIRKGAVKDIEAARQEWAKTDAVLVIEDDVPGALGDIVQTDDGRETNPVHLAMARQYAEDIDSVVGVHAEFRGEGAGANQSGRAAGILAQASEQVLGEPFDNYAAARKHLALMHLANITGRMANRDNVPVNVPRRADRGSRTVMLNGTGEQGERTNDLWNLRVEVALSETPATPTFREAQYDILVEFFKSSPPEVQMQMLDYVVEASNLPNKAELADRLRTKFGIGLPKDPEQAAEVQRQQQRQQQISEMFEELELEEKRALVAKLLSEVDKNTAQTEKTSGVDTEYTEAQTLHEIERAQSEDAEQRRKGLETAAAIVDMAKNPDEGGEKDQ